MNFEQRLARKGIIATAAALALGAVSPALAMPLGGDAATGLVPLVDAQAQATQPAPTPVAPGEAAVLSSEVSTLTQRLDKVERQLAQVEREMQSSRR